MSPTDLKMQDKHSHVPGSEATTIQTYYSPLVDIFETREAVVVMADIPGVQQDKVELSLDNDILTIHARMEEAQPSGTVLLEEYEKGHFMRRFSISETIDQKNIEASLNNGVLKVVLPKSAPREPKKIAVKMG